MCFLKSLHLAGRGSWTYGWSSGSSGHNQGRRARAHAQPGSARIPHHDARGEYMSIHQTYTYCMSYLHRVHCNTPLSTTGGGWRPNTSSRLIRRDHVGPRLTSGPQPNPSIAKTASMRPQHSSNTEVVPGPGVPDDGTPGCSSGAKFRAEPANGK